MELAGLFAFAMFMMLVVGDWMHFTRLAEGAGRYGCRIAKVYDRVSRPPQAMIAGSFDTHGLMNLPHGVARFFREESHILLRPQHRMFSMRFRTAWPIKGSIEVESDGEGTRLIYTKRIPWSSAIITLMWFATVGFGTMGFLIAYIMEGGMASLSSALVGLGVIGIGALVLAFGLITVSLAYRLENDRLTVVYNELRKALTGEE